MPLVSLNPQPKTEQKRFFPQDFRTNLKLSLKNLGREEKFLTHKLKKKTKLNFLNESV